MYFFIFLILSWIRFHVVASQSLPENSCPGYFDYVYDGGSWYGEFRFPSLDLGTNRVDVRFSQRENQPQSVVGPLLPYPSLASAQANTAEGRPVAFRLTLISNGRQLPKVTRLSLNNGVLCQAGDYPPPNSFFNRYYTIITTRTQGTRFNNVNRVESTMNDFMDFNQNSDVSVNTLIYRVGDSSALCCQDQFQEDMPNRWMNRGSGSIRRLSPTIPTRFNPAIWQTEAATLPRSPPTPPVVPITRQMRPQFRPTPSPTLPTIGDMIARKDLCGVEGNTMPLIHRGVDLPRGRFPWLSAIYHKDGTNLNFKCAGSLVSDSIVITAAHCVDGKVASQILIWLGRHDLYSYNEDGAMSRDVESIRSHREFKLRVYSDADVAMLTLRLAVPFTTFIKPICIWLATEPIELRESERGFIAGWGKDEQGNSMTRYPKVAEATVVDEAECLKSLGVSDFTSNRTLCAGNRDGSGPCMGDSGGGMMIKRNGRWMLRGIVSLGQRTSDQCDLSQYVVYCDLAKHIDWVLQGLT